MREAELEGEVIAEEDGELLGSEEVRALPELRASQNAPALREVRTAAIAAAGGALAGVATVAAVRAVSAVGTRKRRPQRLGRKAHQRAANVIASRSFLVDVHLLGE